MIDIDVVVRISPSYNKSEMSAANVFNYRNLGVGSKLICFIEYKNY